jgi:hypothetical protein
MIRHSVRHVVQAGEMGRFVKAFRDMNAAAPAAGLPRYRLWHTIFGDLDEVWAEAEFDSLESHVSAWTNAQANQELMTALHAMVSACVPATIHDYPLELLDG